MILREFLNPVPRLTNSSFQTDQDLKQQPGEISVTTRDSDLRRGDATPRMRPPFRRVCHHGSYKIKSIERLSFSCSLTLSTFTKARSLPAVLGFTADLVPDGPLTRFHQLVLLQCPRSANLTPNELRHFIPVPMTHAGFCNPQKALRPVPRQSEPCKCELARLRVDLWLTSLLIKNSILCQSVVNTVKLESFANIVEPCLSVQPINILNEVQSRGLEHIFGLGSSST